MLRNKSFNRSLSDKHDRAGKEVTAEIMRDLVGVSLVRDNTSETAGDFAEGFWDQMYELPTGRRILVEPEMKDSKWWGESFSADRPFRYEEMDIPFRKNKNKAGLFLVISTCRNYAFLLTRKAMLEHLAASGGEPKIKKTVYEPEGAPYFSTPVTKGFFVAKDSHGRWGRWQAKPPKGIGQ